MDFFEIDYSVNSQIKLNKNNSIDFDKLTKYDKPKLNRNNRVVFDENNELSEKLIFNNNIEDIYSNGKNTNHTQQQISNIKRQYHD